MGQTLWGLINIIGPLILLALLAWVILRSRRSRDEVSKATTEQATKENYEAEQRAHKGEPGSGL